MKAARAEALAVLHEHCNDLLALPVDVTDEDTPASRPAPHKPPPPPPQEPSEQRRVSPYVAPHQRVQAVAIKVPLLLQVLGRASSLL